MATLVQDAKKQSPLPNHIKEQAKRALPKAFLDTNVEEESREFVTKMVKEQAKAAEIELIMTFLEEDQLLKAYALLAAEQNMKKGAVHEDAQKTHMLLEEKLSYIVDKKLLNVLGGMKLPKDIFNALADSAIEGCQKSSTETTSQAYALVVADQESKGIDHPDTQKAKALLEEKVDSIFKNAAPAKEITKKLMDMLLEDARQQIQQLEGRLPNHMRLAFAPSQEFEIQKGLPNCSNSLLNTMPIRC